MEEQKIVSKEIKMNVEKPEKLSYEKLEEVCMQLTQQNKQMEEYIQRCHAQMQQMSQTIQTKRMDYLFKAVELQDNFKSDFIVACCDEIQQALTVPEEGKEE